MRSTTTAMQAADEGHRSPPTRAGPCLLVTSDGTRRPSLEVIEASTPRLYLSCLAMDDGLITKPPIV